MKKYIAYTRVSTSKQDLGLDVQLEIINRFIGKTDEVLATYTEKESGRKSDRPELMKAIQHAKDSGSILLIAKLDRLSRNVAFISTLMDSKVQFKACDIPTADNFTIHIFAALAEREVGLIRERTKSAMNLIKENISKNGYHISKSGNRITSLGGGTFTPEQRELGISVIKQKKASNENLKRAKAFALSLKDNGLNQTQIANLLNTNGFKTSKGFDYTHTQVRRLFV
ncbi:recombinase family protein [Flavobacterium enshiense]|uniref:recombinase family protein n=1 Tax=Flavobacterium enshiense TaxID=1341165 RepID=UPI00345D42A9